MSTLINLKELEQKAYRRTYEDGLLAINIGGLLVSFSILSFNIFPGDVFEPAVAVVLSTVGLVISSLFFWLGKKTITLPRIGMVNFGPQRQKHKRDLIVALSIIVGIQVLAVLFQFGLQSFPELRVRLTPFLGEQFGSALVVAILAVLFVAPGLLLMVYFMEIPRGYFHAVLISLAIFMMILSDQAWWYLAAGIFILGEGIVYLIHFLQKYPLPQEDESHEK
jgi:hypothetical protein